MKIRSGFVSNSSSSSFIVAFPRKPRNVDEMRTMVFGNVSPNETRCPSWDNDSTYGHTVQAMAEQIFSDLNRRNPSSADVNKLTEEMAGLYYWCNSNNCFSFQDDGSLKNDYGWVFKNCSPFFGSDKKTTDDLRDLEIEEEELRDRHRAAEREYFNKLLAKRGIKIPLEGEQTSKEYCEAYQKLTSKAYSTHMGYKKLHTKHSTESQAMWKQQQLLREKAARADAQAMIEANRDKFIAVFEYGDSHGDDVPIGMGTVLEHGGIWGRLPHVVINHH